MTKYCLYLLIDDEPFEYIFEADFLKFNHLSNSYIGSINKTIRQEIDEICIDLNKTLEELTVKAIALKIINLSSKIRNTYNSQIHAEMFTRYFKRHSTHELDILRVELFLSDDSQERILILDEIYRLQEKEYTRILNLYNFDLCQISVK